MTDGFYVSSCLGRAACIFISNYRYNIDTNHDGLIVLKDFYKPKYKYHPEYYYLPIDGMKMSDLDMKLWSAADEWHMGFGIERNNIVIICKKNNNENE